MLTGGGADVAYGRCVLASEIVRFASRSGVQAAALYSPAAPTVTAGDAADRAFQLQISIYSRIGAGLAADAVDNAAELVKLRPNDAQAHAAHGIALTAAGKFAEALKALDEAARLDPKLPALRLDRASALAGLKKTAEAEAELTKAVEESPSDLRAVSALADFYASDEKTADKALTYAARAVQLAPNSPAALLTQARAQSRLKQYADAVKSVEAARKLVPGWPPTYFALAAIHEAAGDKAAAEAAYRKIVELQPKSPDALLALASFLADTGRPAEARDLLKRLRDLNPPQPALDAAKRIEDKLKPASGQMPEADK